MISLQKTTDEQPRMSVVLFEDLAECGWRVFDAGTRQWATMWNEDTNENAPHIHPLLLEWSVTQGAEKQRRVFWIVPNEPVATAVPVVPTAPVEPAAPVATPVPPAGN